MISVGDLVGNKYRITRMIGDGGMGSVWEARHEVLGSAVALKFLHAELARRPGLSARFLQEARVSASIQSPHVIRVTDVDTTTDGTPYLVMELLQGESLQARIDRSLKLGLDEAIDIALQTLAGLEAAHALGVVHRDLKPDNVFVTPSSGGSIIKLLDFGIAKLRHDRHYEKGLTRPGIVMGTPEYMAPEQLYAAEKVDHRADIYSLGAMLYEMLSGERPAYGDDAPEIIARVAQGQIQRITAHVPELPGGLSDAIHKALAPDREQRFASAMEMRLELAPFAKTLSHAGRLAATPAPVSVAMAAPELASPSAQVASRSVPRTLPPEEGIVGAGLAPVAPATFPPEAETGPHTQPGGTQPPGGDPAPGGYVPGVPGGPAPQGVTTPGAAPAPAYGAYGAAPPPPPPRRSGAPWGAILGLLLALMGLGAAAIYFGFFYGPADDGRPALPIEQQPTPAATIAGPAPTNGGDSVEPPVVATVVEPTPAVVSPRPRGTATATTLPTTLPTLPTTEVQDAGSGPQDAGGVPSFPIQIPSSFPPIPTGPIPGIPGIPGFPGFQGPAPSPSSSP